MPLWEGRFNGNIDPQMWALNSSLSYDRRMAQQDVRGSLAWTEALREAGILTVEEAIEITAGLERIFDSFQTDEFTFKPGDEDIHTAVERRLTELIGPLAGKLHTGRSRNDQVVTDLRLWLMDHLPKMDAAMTDLQEALVWQAESDMTTLMPGYTHLQRAQPVLLSHWWLSHFWPLNRDRQRLVDQKTRLAVLPLGCGALAGVPFAVDRFALAKHLGFAAPAPNSMDAVSDRDFAAEFLFTTALTGIHLSRLAETVVLFSSVEFGFFELDDAFSTGSSLMPQKKNPDGFELARAKAGVLLSHLTRLLAVLKALPSAYDKDLQEDKLPVFESYDILTILLPVLANAIRSLTVNKERMEAAIDSMLMATDLADHLVEKGLPFRDAHKITGQVVRLALRLKKTLVELSPQEFASVYPGFDETVYQVLDPGYSVSRRKSFGGTAPGAVREQIKTAKQIMNQGGATYV